MAEKTRNIPPDGLPASQKESSQQGVSVTGLDFVLADQLVHYFLSHSGQGAGIHVEDDSS